MSASQIRENMTEWSKRKCLHSSRSFPTLPITQNGIRAQHSAGESLWLVVFGNRFEKDTKKHIVNILSKIRPGGCVNKGYKVGNPGLHYLTTTKHKLY